MLRIQAEMIKDEAIARNIYCKLFNNGDIYWIELGTRPHKWLSYWYAVMDLWEMEFKKEGIKL